VEQKISAAEKWLKIMERSYRQRTRRQKRLSLGSCGLKQRWRSFCQQKDGIAP